MKNEHPAEIFNSEEEEWLSLIKEGESLLEIGNNEHAQMRFEEAVSHLERKERFFEAALICHKILRINPGKIGLLKKLGEIYLRNSMKEGAIRYFLKYAEEKRRKNQWEKFLEIYERVAEINPVEGTAALKFKVIKDMVGEIKGKKFQKIKKSKEFSKEEIETLNELHRKGDDYLKQGLVETAKKTYNKILALNPLDIQANEALLNLGLKNKDEKACVERVMALAYGLIEKKMDEDAETVIKRVLSEFPNNQELSDALSSLSRLDSNMPSQDLDSLIKEFKTLVLRTDERDLSSYYKLGLKYKEEGYVSPALEEFKTALHDPSFRKMAIEALSELGVKEEIISPLRQLEAMKEKEEIKGEIKEIKEETTVSEEKVLEKVVPPIDRHIIFV